MSASDIWYPITDSHPAPLVRVRGIVNCGPYDAHIIVSRGRAPHVMSWASWKGEKATPLKAPPAVWQPQHPDRWDSPLPPPVPTIGARLWSSTMRFQAVEEAVGADLAREMENDREMARSGSSAILEAEIGRAHV